ncbi:hypothetical protein V7112_21280 [Bacillus sp. JJ1566]|uniref:hypothetical protein n=1 Tax=Bacillus sp. JJ1566 TaxID=3122961 RepID=UPI002FFE7613
MEFMVDPLVYKYSLIFRDKVTIMATADIFQVMGITMATADIFQVMGIITVMEDFIQVMGITTVMAITTAIAATIPDLA